MAYIPLPCFSINKASDPSLWINIRVMKNRQLIWKIELAYLLTLANCSLMDRDIPNDYNIY